MSDGFLLFIVEFNYLVVFLTHLFPVDPFSTPGKHQKTLRFSDVFKG